MKTTGESNRNYPRSKHECSDETLLKLLICSTQGIDGCYQECNKIPSTGDVCAYSGCPFATDLADDLPDWARDPHNGPEIRHLYAVYYLARRFAELIRSPLQADIHIPYLEDSSPERGQDEI